MHNSNTQTKIPHKSPAVKIFTSIFLALALSACASTLEGIKEDIRGLSGSEAPQKKGGLIKTANSSSMVKEIQEKLNSLGYKPGDPTGTINTKTEAAIQDFQLDHGMVIDGKPSKSLLRALNNQEQS